MALGCGSSISPVSVLHLTTRQHEGGLISLRFYRDVTANKLAGTFLTNALRYINIVLMITFIYKRYPASFHYVDLMQTQTSSKQANFIINLSGHATEPVNGMCYTNISL